MEQNPYKNFFASLHGIADAFHTAANFADDLANHITGHPEDIAHFAALASPLVSAPPANNNKRKRRPSESEGEVNGEAVPSGKPPKRKRAPKDPNAPKKAAGAYLTYQNRHRQEVKEANPDKSNTEILTIIAENWKSAPAAEKEEIQKIVEKDKVRYEAQMKVYENRSPEEKAADDAKTAEINAKKRPRKSAAAAPKSKATPPAAAPVQKPKTAAAPAPPAAKPVAAKSVESSVESSESASETESEEDAKKPSKSKPAVNKPQSKVKTNGAVVKKPLQPEPESSSAEDDSDSSGASDSSSSEESSDEDEDDEEEEVAPKVPVKPAPKKPKTTK